MAVFFWGGFSSFSPLPQNGASSAKGGQNSASTSSSQATITKTALNKTGFDAITEYLLPQKGLFPNGITAARDGSVWFGEQGLPGVAHLFSNGTLVEYAWPQSPAYRASPNGAVLKTQIWGVALWNGGVWASDTAGNELVGLDPSTGSVMTVRIPVNDSYPFALTVGPDNSLWFTELQAAEVGRIFPNYTLVEYPVPSSVQGTVTDLTFVNGTGYFVTDGVYAFNPRLGFNPTMVSTPQLLYQPVGISYGNGSLWAAEHDTSDVISYNFGSHVWTTYPTSTENYTLTTLPYFVTVNGSYVWFNEHYGNRMARLNLRNGTLTEYSESDPPVTTGFNITTALTFAVKGDRVWFTASTANFVGYVDASFSPTFSISAQSNSSMVIPQGGTGKATFLVYGFSRNPLTLQFSDSEENFAYRTGIQMNSTVRTIHSLNGQQTIIVTIIVGSNVAPGTYKLLVTVSDGLVYRSKYLTLLVSAEGSS